MIRVRTLPARFGDCILVEYGERKAPSRVLIDAGLAATYKDVLRDCLSEIAPCVPLELLIVTHIDRDHICGILPLLREAPAVVAPEDIWFNGRHHLDDALGVAEGEALGRLLKDHEWPWNKAFGRGAVVVPDAGPLPVRLLPGGAKLTLLSPYPENLSRLGEEWDDALGSWDKDPAGGFPQPSEPDDVLGKPPPLDSIDANVIAALLKAKFKEDDKAPNGSSIAFLFEYDGTTILFGADAHPSMIERSLARLSTDRTKLDAFKLSHHGSKANLSPSLLAKIDCDRFLISSNGDSFGHPNPETIARIVASPGRTLCFNYASAYTKVWNDAAMKRKFEYATEFPQDGSLGHVWEI